MKGLILVFAAALFLAMPSKVIAAQDAGVDEYSTVGQIVDKILAEQELDGIDSAAGTDFTGLVRDIVTGGVDTGSMDIKDRIINAVTKEFRSNIKGIIQILLIAVISALFTNFANIFSDASISKAGLQVSKIAAVTVLLAVYSCTEQISLEVLSDVIEFLKLLMPAYLSCVAVSSGSLSVAAFSEGAMLMVLVINVVFSKIVITGGNIYILITAADGITGERSLEKASKLIMTAMNWVIKTSMAAVIGLNLIQGMVVPMADGLQTGILTKAMKLIPGIGSSVSTLSSTLLGAGTLIKNGMGAAALVVIVTICAVPVAKLAMFVITYQFAGAFVQPVCGKGFADMITDFAQGMKLMMSIVVYSVITVFIVIAIICISTNNYHI